MANLPNFFNIILVITDLQGIVYTLESACQISQNKQTKPPLCKFLLEFINKYEKN